MPAAKSTKSYKDLYEEMDAAIETGNNRTLICNDKSDAERLRRGLNNARVMWRRRWKLDDPTIAEIYDSLHFKVKECEVIIDHKFVEFEVKEGDSPND